MESWDPSFVGPVDPSSPVGQAFRVLGVSVNAPPSNVSVAVDASRQTATVSPWSPYTGTQTLQFQTSAASRGVSLGGVGMGPLLLLGALGAAALFLRRR